MTKDVTIQDIFSGDASPQRLKGQIAQYLNTPPPEKWIREHPTAKGVKYLPADKIEYLLTVIFLAWRVEVRETQIIANSIAMTVRLHIEVPDADGESYWLYFDGVGAAPISTDKGAAATDFTKVKTLSVQKALPAAKSFAFKNAAKSIGLLFGRDLNRNAIGNDYSVVSRRTRQPGSSTKEVLDTSHHKWDGIVNALQQGVHTIESVKEHFELTKEYEELLCKLSESGAAQ